MRLGIIAYIAHQQVKHDALAPTGFTASGRVQVRLTLHHIVSRRLAHISRSMYFMVSGMGSRRRTPTLLSTGSRMPHRSGLHVFPNHTSSTGTEHDLSPWMYHKSGCGRTRASSTTCDAHLPRRVDCGSSRSTSIESLSDSPPL